MVVSAGLLGGLFYIGQSSIRAMLVRDAGAKALIWFQNSVDNRAETLIALSRDSSPLAPKSLKTAGIDALVLIEGANNVVPAEGTHHTAVAEFNAATAAIREHQDLTMLKIPTGAYTSGNVGLISKSRFSTWIAFPASPDGPVRLAARFVQSQSAAALALRFRREFIYSGGVAAVTFFAFMGGFTYRSRRIGEDGEDLRFLALHDELTGLPNRKQFEDKLKEAVAAAERNSQKCALLMIDLDGFKSINDTLGHPIGDGLLRAAANRLKGSVRGDDLLARLSGDEFAILVPVIEDTASLKPFADRVLELLSTSFRIDGHEVLISGSLGIAVAPDNGDTGDKLVRNADFALYRAKSEGRRTWRFFDPKMAEDLKSRRTLEDGLRFALENDLFTLLYQPQYDLVSNQVTGYEALLRWRLPGKGLVPTSMFLSIAEETGLIIPMGEWVIRQVARDCAILPPNARIAINLSAAQLKRQGIEEFIKDTLGAYNVDPERIDIEVNESILGRNEDDAFARLETIREIGISIVMDNFGVGTSSLGLLSRYPFDKIKVDRSFMSGIDGNEKKRAVVAAICSLGQSLGMDVAGEGVESREHAEILREAGCGQAQGYYFGHPESLDTLFRQQSEDKKPISLAAIA
jgi:diguanylate cyclase (GGDEF)-like protein